MSPSKLSADHRTNSSFRLNNCKTKRSYDLSLEENKTVVSDAN